MKFRKLPNVAWERRYTIVYRSHFYNGDVVRCSWSTHSGLYLGHLKKRIASYWKWRWTMKCYDGRLRREDEDVWIRGDDR